MNSDLSRRMRPAMCAMLAEKLVTMPALAAQMTDALPPAIWR
jgi:hypothetical protein